MWIVDDGDGMSLKDLREKWLFVAFSSKSQNKGGAATSQPVRRHFAGSKGIGRFSADRLGASLVLQASSRIEVNSVHQIAVNWDDFEADSQKNFEEIGVSYQSLDSFQLSPELQSVSSGVALKISRLRTVWDRSKILHLRRSLAKLINPFGSADGGFEIVIIAPEERAADDKARQASSDVPPEVVNGKVGNFIFSALEEKTTYLKVILTDEGESIESTLIDRGEMIFRIKEPSPYPELMASGFSCQLFYLNQSAKMTFARRMGMPSIRFGSVFLFRNGFRVFPVGDDGDDWFGIDARKQQGYARYLGTRDLIGRIDVSGSESQFKEASSRNQGLVDTEAARELRDLFWEYCLKRLERYVVPVSWADKGEALSEDLSRLMTDAGRARVASAVAKLIDGPHIELLDYSRNLIAIVNERSAQFEASLDALQEIASKTEDLDLSKSLKAAQRRFSELKAAEAEALRRAEAERLAREAAQADALAALELADEATKGFIEERARALLLTSLTSLDSQNIINMHHQITIYAGDMKQQIDNCISASRNKDFTQSDLRSRLEQLAFVNQKILSIARLATKANFRLESDSIEADLSSYIEQYIKEEATRIVTKPIKIDINGGSVEFTRRFRPMEISIVVDNLISNSVKAGATRLCFEFSLEGKDTLEIVVTDNGKGFPANMEDLDRIFDLGFSRGTGSGLGLYHVRQVLGDMGGSIAAEAVDRGAAFLIRIVR